MVVSVADGFQQKIVFDFVHCVLRILDTKKVANVRLHSRLSVESGYILNQRAVGVK